MADLDCDIVVIGGGIAGVSVAAHLSAHANVHLLEMERHLAYHSTGRSVALFSQTYGNEAIRALSVASRGFFFSPPPDFCATPLVRPRLVITIAPHARAGALEEFARSAGAMEPIERLSPDQAVRLCPILRPQVLAGAVLETGSADIDVHGLHQGYLRWFKTRGGTVTTQAEVSGLKPRGGLWEIATRETVLRARIVVNAAGAWAGELGRSAGAIDIGLEPCRRTVVLLDPPPGASVDAWPMVLDVDEAFYLKPDAGLLLLSPADETPTAPCDVQPEDWDVAVAVERLQQMTTLEVKGIRRKWAGLRSFVADRSPVVGYDPRQPGFFWLAALGGYGLQTAPALSALAASLVLGRLRPGDLEGFDPDMLAASRFGHTRLR